MAGTPSLFAGIGAQFFDNTGNVLTGGKIYTYRAGTTTPVATYTTEAANVAHSNPIILDAAGRVPASGEIWLIEGVGINYKFVIRDANDVLLSTYDDVPGSYSSTDLANASDPTKGDALVGFRQSNDSGNLTGTVNSTVHKKLQEFVSVKDFGAIGDGAANDTAAFQAAYNAVPANGAIIIPPGTYSVSSLTRSKNIIWLSQGALNGAGTAPIDLPGIVNTAFENRQLIRQTTSTATDVATLNITRNATHTGGTAGFVNSALRVETVASANVSNFEWSLLGRIENSSTLGENVGIYGQAIKNANAGPTWAGCYEIRDLSGNANPTSGTIGIEIGMFVNGTDNNKLRVALDVVVSKGVSTGAKAEAAYGIRIGPANNDATSGEFTTALQIKGNSATGIELITAGIYGIYFSGAKTVGIDLSSGTYSSSAIRLAAEQKIAFDNTDANCLAYVPSLSGLGYTPNGGVSYTHVLKTNGNLRFTGKLDLLSPGNTSSTAASGTATLPANPAGFLLILIDNTTYKVPYYAN